MKENNISVAIVGCGWLGLPLAQQLDERGFEVKGTTRSAAKSALLKQQGIQPFVLDLNSGASIQKELLEISSLVINLPPGRRDPQRLSNYADAVDQLLREAASYSQVKNVVFVSSTSVYGEDLNEFTEETPAQPVTASGKAIREAEIRVMECGIPYTILRFGGLAGPGRHPGKFLAGRKDLPSGEQSINFLHLDDAVGVIVYMLEHDVKDEIFNVVSPIHPNKKIFYSEMAASIGLEPPTFADDGLKLKREMSADKLLIKTDFKFQYPDPMCYRFED